MLLFQSPSWKSGKSRKAKSRLLMFARLSTKKISAYDYRVLKKERAKAGFDVYQVDTDTIGSDGYHAIEKQSV